ncbi:N [Pacora virus]|uniref:Nucleoprotein n=1 Tax=Pacora virus TaxID=2748244 RepID=A0A7D9MVW0_9VIRU|nr:N [Pacora virus] [Pacora virus]QLA47046.1 N [Pacora virus] [Pacora virus]
MATSGFEFSYESTRGANVFDPRQAYEGFVSAYGDQLTLQNIRTFFLRAKACKLKMRVSNLPVITAGFGTLQLPLVNCYNNSGNEAGLLQTALTLRRVSGYLALFLLTHYGGSEPKRQALAESIINPIAAKKGIDWRIGVIPYLAIFPGTEMFMEEFEFYPLATAMYRIQKNELTSKFLDRLFKQKIGGVPASTWTQTRRDEINAAMAYLQKQKWEDKVSEVYDENVLSLLKEHGIADPRSGDITFTRPNGQGNFSMSIPISGSKPPSLSQSQQQGAGSSATAMIGLLDRINGQNIGGMTADQLLALINARR